MNTRICVAHVITQLELGGAQQNTLHTVEHLNRERFAPALLTGPGGELEPRARALRDLAFFSIPHLLRPIAPASDLRALQELTWALSRAPRPLLVHTHSSKAGVLGRLAARAAGADAVVHSVHGFAFHEGQTAAKRGAFTMAERLAAPLADAYICVSRADLERGQRLGLFGAARVELIRSGIVFDQFRYRDEDRRRIRTELSIPADAPVIGTVANFKPQKAPLDFVAVAARALDARPQARFIYVGDGALRPEVERAARAARIQDRLHLVGWQRDVAAYLSAIDVFLLTSHHEGLPRSVLQALTSGCAVVATRTGGPDEVVDPELLAAPGDLAGLCARVLTALDRPRRSRAALPLPAHLRGFSADRMVLDQERLYRELIERR